LFEIAVQSGLNLDQLAADFTAYPQKLVNIRVREKKPIAQLPAVQAEIERCEAEFDGAGRVLVRFSGTEPLLRVMVEGPRLEQVEQFTERIAASIRREIGIE
jgi:phosphoglucosamine mutase